ncbi:hypothetical protein TNCV_1601131 [Trichonephila clavipes]|nr:hypothetical protein TNCV_1601131 [Trichonephila clavipes]
MARRLNARLGNQFQGMLDVGELQDCPIDTPANNGPYILFTAHQDKTTPMLHGFNHNSFGNMTKNFSEHDFAASKATVYDVVDDEIENNSAGSRKQNIIPPKEPEHMENAD